MKYLAAAALLCGSMAFAQLADPPGFHYWSHDDLQKMTRGLAPQMDPQTKLKSQTIVTQGNHRFLISHREGGGEAEFHETEEDIVYVQSGHATLIYGGKMVDSKTTAPGELRGPGIEGGEKKLLSPGDVVVVPARIPHQFIADAKDPLNYFVVKVTEQKSSEKK